VPDKLRGVGAQASRAVAWVVVGDFCNFKSLILARVSEHFYAEKLIDKGLFKEGTSIYPAAKYSEPCRRRLRVDEDQTYTFFNCRINKNRRERAKFAPNSVDGTFTPCKALIYTNAPQARNLTAQQVLRSSQERSELPIGQPNQLESGHTHHESEGDDEPAVGEFVDA
jgi:hypothetical protein